MEAYERLEIKWAEFNQLDPKGMVACSSGTAALHLAMEAMQLPRGSEVITSDFNMIAVPVAIELAGLRPVFADCDERLLMDLECAGRAKNHFGSSSLLSVVARPISAVLSVHVYGRKCGDDLLEAAGIWNYKQIEDLAEAHGVNPHPNTDAATWSFYRNKIVAGEEGGAVWFKDHHQAALARQLRTLGFTPDHDFVHLPRGHNYRMSNLHANYILDNSIYFNRNSLPHYCQNVEIRRDIENQYDSLCPPEFRMPPRQAVWVYDLRIPGLTRGRQQQIVKALNGRGIPARMSFYPMSEQPQFRQGCYYQPSYLPYVLDTPPIHKRSPNAWKASQEVFYLPVQPGITEPKRIWEALESILRDSLVANS